eukprot:GDKK01049309.1.p2 GENE.GDKK01049309.1~~GDKK01049309.1.p2  ORF type:complete len:148 (-),score=17.58 GDKK01049309.1:73-516(-)
MFALNVSSSESRNCCSLHNARNHLDSQPTFENRQLLTCSFPSDCFKSALLCSSNKRSSRRRHISDFVAVSSPPLRLKRSKKFGIILTHHHKVSVFTFTRELADSDFVSPSPPDDDAPVGTRKTCGSAFSSSDQQRALHHSKTEKRRL